MNIQPAERVALISGAASGIGEAVATRLAKAGMAIAAIDLDTERLGALEQELGKRVPVMTGCVDVRDGGAVNAFVERVAATLGVPTAVVCSAGIARSSPAESMSHRDFTEVLDINLTGTFLVCQATARHMLAKGGGSIVCLASVTSKGGHPGRANYAASKWGVVGLVKTLALEWGGRKVRVNAVAPNGVNTPMLIDGVPRRYREGVILDRTPLGRFAEPGDVADAVAFLLSAEAAYITGAVLEVDGGLTAGYLTHEGGADYGTGRPVERIEPAVTDMTRNNRGVGQ